MYGEARGLYGHFIARCVITPPNFVGNGFLPISIYWYLESSETIWHRLIDQGYIPLVYHVPYARFVLINSQRYTSISIITIMSNIIITKPFDILR